MLALSDDGVGRAGAEIESRDNGESVTPGGLGKCVSSTRQEDLAGAIAAAGGATAAGSGGR